MKFKGIINFSTTTFLSFTLLASAAQASVINSFTWDAQCTDCFSETVGVANDAGSTFVSGEISLADYNFGDPITTANFNSFTYNGPSRWIESFTVDSVDYLSGMLTDTGLLSLQFTSTFGELTAEAITSADIEALTIALQDAESAEHAVKLQVIAAAMRVNSLKADAARALSDFRNGPNGDVYLNLINGQKSLTIAKAEGRDQTRALNQIAAAEENLSTIAEYQPVLAARKAVSDAIKANNALYGPQLSDAEAEVTSANRALNQAISEQARQEVANQAYRVNILQSGDWDISLLSQDFDVAIRPLDFGTAARVLPVPEPSTLAIFALGIMGLASRKFKK
jgi:hypothetical protein